MGLVGCCGTCTQLVDSTVWGWTKPSAAGCQFGAGVVGPRYHLFSGIDMAPLVSHLQESVQVCTELLQGEPVLVFPSVLAYGGGLQTLFCVVHIAIDGHLELSVG